MDQDLLQQLHDLLAESPKWDEWGVIGWLRSRADLNYDTANAYLIAAVRQWGLEQEQNRPSSIVAQFSPSLMQRLAERKATPADWAEALQSGMYLERCAAFLPWDASLAALERMGGNETSRNSGFLAWPNETIFGGLQVKLSTCSLLSSRGLYRLNCTPEDYQVYGDLDTGLAPELLHLKKALGEPNYGEYTWLFGDIVLSIEAYSPNDFHSSASYHKYIALEQRKR